MRIGAEKLSQLRLYKWCWMPKTNKQHRARWAADSSVKQQPRLERSASCHDALWLWKYIVAKEVCQSIRSLEVAGTLAQMTFLVAVSLLSPNRTDSAVRQFLQTALALNKSPLVSCLEIWRFPDLGPGWVPSENGSIRSPSRESSESTSLGVKHTVMLQRLHRLTGTTPGPKLAWHKKARPPTSLLSVECR